LAAYLVRRVATGFARKSVPFDNDPDAAASLFEHCKRSFEDTLLRTGAAAAAAHRRAY